MPGRRRGARRVMNSCTVTVAACFLDEQGQLVVRDAAGSEHRGLRPVRLFPITDPDGSIAICDEQGRELACIERIEALPADSREVVAHELRRRTFTPVITRITRSIPFGEYVRLFIETDRGATDITVDTEDIYRLSDNRMLLKDVNGIRYLIPDWRKMSGHSRRILDAYL